MIISKYQFEKFSEYRHEMFVSKCVEFVRTNYTESKYNELHERAIQLINDVISFSFKYNINKEINIQKMINIQINYNYLDLDPLPNTLKYHLDFPDREEDVKVEFFHKQIIFIYGNSSK